MSKYNTIKLADMGYGDVTHDGATVELTDAEVKALAESVGGTVAEIETARCASKTEIEKMLGDTDGQGGKSWDPLVLSYAADSCMRGEDPYKFEGHPDGQAEMERFAAVWKACQD